MNPSGVKPEDQKRALCHGGRGLCDNRAVLKEIYQAQEGKAFPYRVELTDAGGPLLGGSVPASYNDYNDLTSTQLRTATPISQREAAVHLQTYGGFEAIDWLSDATNMISTSAASAGWHFDDDGKELAARILPTDPAGTAQAPASLVKLIEEPNPFMEWSDLCELTLIDWLIVGNAYWVKWKSNAQGQPLALYRMAPQCVKIEPGQFGPAKYLYRLPGATEDVEFTPDEVIHFKRPNPHNPYYGMGVVKAGARALDMELGLTKTMASFYERQALPSGVVQTERRVPRDVFNKLKRQLQSFYSGGANSGKLMVLEAGLQYKSVSLNAQEAAFLTMGQWSRDRTLAHFHINKSLLGIWDSGDNPNIGLWQTLFDQKTMIPICNKFSKAISRGLTAPGWGINFVIDYTETQQPDDVLNRAGTLSKIPGVKVKEVRVAAGLPASTGDAEIDETVLNLPGPQLDANGQGGFPDPNLPNEPGRPPLPANTKKIGIVKPAPASATDKNVKVAKGKKSLEEVVAELEASLIGAKALAPADHVHIGKLSGSHVTPPEDLLHGKRTTELDALRAAVATDLQQAAHTLERGLLDAAEGKADGTIYQRIKKAAAWTAFKDKVTSILSEAAQQAMSIASVHHVNQGLDSADIDYEDAAKEIVYRKSGGVGSIVKTLQKSVMDKVLKAQQKGNGADVPGIIRDTITTWQDGNATGVALDIATQGYNESTLLIAEANGASHVIVSDGEDYDEPCINANAATWTISKAHDNMQEHPNCTRAFVPVIT